LTWNSSKSIILQNLLAKQEEARIFFGENWEKERRFVGSVKYEYGFLGENDINPSDPQFAEYFWVKHNEGIDAGKLKIHKYKGEFQTGNSIENELVDGEKIYRARFKGGVDVYDSKSDESYVLFFPSNYYNSPRYLKMAGPYLIIGMIDHDKIAIINTENLHIKKIYMKNKFIDIENLEILDSILRLNISTEMEFDKF